MDVIDIPGISIREANTSMRKKLIDFIENEPKVEMIKKDKVDRLITEISKDQETGKLLHKSTSDLFLDRDIDFADYVVDELFYELNITPSKSFPLDQNRDVVIAILSTGEWNAEMVRRIFQLERRELECIRSTFDSTKSQSTFETVQKLIVPGKFVPGKNVGALVIPGSEGYYLGQLSYYKLSNIKLNRYHSSLSLIPLCYRKGDTAKDIRELFEYLDVIIPERYQGETPNKTLLNYYPVFLDDIKSYQSIFEQSKHYHKKLTRDPKSGFFIPEKGQTIAPKSSIHEFRGEDFMNSYILRFTDKEYAKNFSLIDWKNRSDLQSVVSSIAANLSRPWRLDNESCNNLGDYTVDGEERDPENMFVIGYAPGEEIAQGIFTEESQYKCIGLDELEQVIVYANTDRNEQGEGGEAEGDKGYIKFLNKDLLEDYNGRYELNLAALEKDLVDGKLSNDFINDHISEYHMPGASIKEIKKAALKDFDYRADVFDELEKIGKTMGKDIEEIRVILKDRNVKNAINERLKRDEKLRKIMKGNTVDEILVNLNRGFTNRVLTWDQSMEYPDKYVNKNKPSEGRFVATISSKMDLKDIVDKKKAEDYFSDKTFYLPKGFQIVRLDQIGEPHTVPAILDELDIRSLRALLKDLDRYKENFKLNEIERGIVGRLISIIPVNVIVPGLEDFAKMYRNFNPNQKTIFQSWLAWIFIHAMFFRWWEGPNMPLPVTKPDAHVCNTPEMIDQRTSFCIISLKMKDEILIPRDDKEYLERNEHFAGNKEWIANNQEFLKEDKERVERNKEWLQENKPVVEFIDRFRKIDVKDGIPVLENQKIESLITANINDRECGAFLSDYLIFTAYYGYISIMKGNENDFNKFINDWWKQLVPEFYKAACQFLKIEPVKEIGDKLSSEQISQRKEFVPKNVTNKVIADLKKMTPQTTEITKKINGLEITKVHNHVAYCFINGYESGVWSKATLEFKMEDFSRNIHTA